MTWRVHHYYPCGTGNSGDDLVAHTLRQVLTRHLGPATFVSIPATERCRTTGGPIGLCLDNIQRSNAEADLVLVGGSNMLEPRKIRSRADCNIPLVIDPIALASLRKPLVLAGMGTGSSFGRSIASYSPGARDCLRQLFSQAVCHAVRDTTTVRELGRIGIHTECTGCPVTFLTDRLVRPAPSSLPLLVSFPPERILRRFLGPSFFQMAMRYLAWLQGEGVPVVVTLHDATDRELARTRVPHGIEIFYTENVAELMGRFEQCRGVIGFRLHAGLLGLGLGKPIIPVGVDWRGLAFIETTGLADLAIRPFRLGQLGKLQNLTQRLLQSDATLLARLNQARETLRGKHEAFFQSVGTRLLRTHRQAG